MLEAENCGSRGDTCKLRTPPPLPSSRSNSNSKNNLAKLLKTCQGTPAPANIENVCQILIPYGLTQICQSMSTPSLLILFDKTQCLANSPLCYADTISHVLQDCCWGYNLRSMRASQVGAPLVPYRWNRGFGWCAHVYMAVCQLFRTDFATIWRIIGPIPLKLG